MAVDLSASEIVIVTMLAHLGAAGLSGDRDAVQELGDMIVRVDPHAVVSSAALEKLEASLTAARSMIDPTQVS
jgi:hypothetical protein